MGIVQQLVRIGSMWWHGGRLPALSPAVSGNAVIDRRAALTKSQSLRALWVQPVVAWVAVAGVLLSAVSPAMAAEGEDGFVSIFDGKTLKNWDGNPEFWSVKDGAITGITTPEKPTSGNTFIVYRGEELGDFELKLDYKIVGGNSGIQYRSFEVPNEKWVIGGYQADIDSGPTFSGINYGERFRGILANRGEKTKITAEHKPELIERFADSGELQKTLKPEEWNSYHLVAQGFHFTHKINDVLMSECFDEDGEMRRATGVLALQLHAGPPMNVQFKNIRIKKLPKKVVLLSGRPSHGFGAHDHLSGTSLLARLLNASGLPVDAKVYRNDEQNGWPKDPSVLNDAATIVIYSDGGGGHPFNAHVKELDELTRRGAGIVCIHYGVETPKGESGQAFLDWTGGYFETDWSVNPHWVAKYQKFPEHAVCRGVKPFSTNDEWYYHMRFREGMDGVTPILTDLPPDETLSRGDGPHSGNPAVREAIKKKEPQHMAWARQRPNGGRGFGCTGGHVHWNWGNDQFRKLMLNAIVWTAGLDVPAGGVPAGKITVKDLLLDHDEEVPSDFNPARIQAMLDEWNRG